MKFHPIAIVGILLIHAGFRLLEQTLPRRFGRVDARYFFDH